MAKGFVLMSVVTSNLWTNEKCKLDFLGRMKHINKFFENHHPKPDVLLIQEAHTLHCQQDDFPHSSPYSQIKDLLFSLSKDSVLWCAYSEEHHQERPKTKKYNLVISKNVFSPFQTRFQNQTDSRFCAQKIVFQSETVLAVSFHGRYRIPIVDRIKELLDYIAKFVELKRSSGSGHVLIGGDFNLDLDEFEKDHIPFLDSLGLKVVHYSNQRDGQKFDGLICDKDIRVANVTVYSENLPNDVHFRDGQLDVHFRVDQTDVISSKIPKHVMDHHPIKFDLMLPQK